MAGGKTFSLNVIPTQASAGFDIRVPPDTPISEVRALLDGWCGAEGLSWRFAPWAGEVDGHAVTSIDPKVNPWWSVFSSSMNAQGLTVEPEIFPAGTDSRFLRLLGVPALGFSPMSNSPVLLHEHDEYLDRAVYLKGIGVYERLLCDLASHRIASHRIA